MSETLTGRTTREIVFTVTDPRTKVVTATVRKPAGTEVYARARRDGLSIRIPGTLFAQHVSAASVEAF